MPTPAKHYFVNEEDIIYLADYLLMYPCNTYLHLSYAFMHQRLKTYIETENENAKEKSKISIYSFPIKHMTHEYICDNFAKIVFRKENIERFTKDIERLSVLTADTVHTQDFCAPDNITAIAPQIAYLIRKLASKVEVDKFDAELAKELFYARENDIHPSDTVSPRMMQNRPDWQLSYGTLWPDELSFSRGEFSKDYMIDVILPQFRDGLIRGGITSPKEQAKLLDSRFPGTLTDHKMGALVRPKEAKKIKYPSVRSYGRNVRGKKKPQ